MMTLWKSAKKLQQKVVDEKCDKRRILLKIPDASEMQDFLQLNETDLRDLTVYVYQIRQAKSYSKELQTDARKYQIFVNKEHDGVLKAQQRSRHTNSRA